MIITIVFKSGYSLTIRCEKFTIKKNVFEQITGYQIEGIQDCKPLYINFEEVICVYREIGAEEDND